MKINENWSRTHCTSNNITTRMTNILITFTIPSNHSSGKTAKIITKSKYANYAVENNVLPLSSQWRHMDLGPFISPTSRLYVQILLDRITPITNTPPCFTCLFEGSHRCPLNFSHKLYHTWVWNRGICMCVIVRPRSHMLIVLKK